MSPKHEAALEDLIRSDISTAAAVVSSSSILLMLLLLAAAFKLNQNWQQCRAETHSCCTPKRRKGKRRRFWPWKEGCGDSVYVSKPPKECEDEGPIFPPPPPPSLLRNETPLWRARKKGGIAFSLDDVWVLVSRKVSQVQTVTGRDDKAAQLFLKLHVRGIFSHVMVDDRTRSHFTGLTWSSVTMTKWSPFLS